MIEVKDEEATEHEVVSFAIAADPENQAVLLALRGNEETRLFAMSADEAKNLAGLLLDRSEGLESMEGS